MHILKRTQWLNSNIPLSSCTVSVHPEIRQDTGRTSLFLPLLWDLKWKAWRLGTEECHLKITSCRSSTDAVHWSQIKKHLGFPYKPSSEVLRLRSEAGVKEGVASFQDQTSKSHGIPSTTLHRGSWDSLWQSQTYLDSRRGNIASDSSSLGGRNINHYYRNSGKG